MSLDNIQKSISPVFDKFGIKYAGVFGSVARNEETPESDIDIFVRLGKPMTLVSYSFFIESLEKVLHKKVDVVTDRSINSFLKPYIMADLKTIYEK